MRDEERLKAEVEEISCKPWAFSHKLYNHTMKMLEILLIALGLSMDAFAVAVASGATMKKLHIPRAVKMGFFFGGFQALMPALGWLAGFKLKNYILGFDHWAAFGLLGFIGGKMISGSFKMEEGQNCGGKPSLLTRERSPCFPSPPA